MLRRFLPAATLAVAVLWTPASAQGVEPGMPAADGRPMLWPAAIAVPENAGHGLPVMVTHYGFVDGSAELVVPAGYTSYSYCADTEGRPAAVLARGNQGSDLIDFTGEVVGHLASGHSECVGTDHLITAGLVDGQWGFGVVEAATGDPVLDPAARQKVVAVTSGVVNVSRPQGEYFLDLGSGVSSPHPGRVTVAGLEPGAPGVPAEEDRSANGTPAGRLGYLSRSGEWLLPPQFDTASAFRSGYAVVGQGGRQTFLDTGLRRVGGEWDRIRPITVPAALGERVIGYWVEADDRRGLLDAELRTVVQPGPGRIDCDADALGVCAVVAPDGSADLVPLPQGGATTLPAGFTRVLNPGMVADRPSPGKAAETRIRSLISGRTVTVPGAAGCRGVGQLFVSCPGSVVLDAGGEQTGFRSVAVVADPAGGLAYYWVTTDTEQGFLDPDGRWRYRARR